MFGPGRVWWRGARGWGARWTRSCAFTSRPSPRIWCGAGVPREEAQRRARIEFGGIERVKEEGREARGFATRVDPIVALRYE